MHHQFGICSFVRRRISVIRGLTHLVTFPHMGSLEIEKFMPWFNSSGGCQQPSGLIPTVANWFCCPTFKEGRRGKVGANDQTLSGKHIFPRNHWETSGYSSGARTGSHGLLCCRGAGKASLHFSACAMEGGKREGGGMAVGEQIQSYLPRTFNEQNPIWSSSK